MSLPMPAYQQPAVNANCVAGDGAPPARLSDRVRMDTRPVTTSDGAEASAHEQATLDRLESTRKYHNTFQGANWDNRNVSHDYAAS